MTTTTDTTDTRSRSEYQYCRNCINRTRDAKTMFCDACIASGRMFNTTLDIIRANEQAGYHFFDADTRRFFNSRVLNGVIGRDLFITSERYDVDATRGYTIRRANADGSIDTVGEFQQYATAAQARAAARKLAGN